MRISATTPVFDPAALQASQQAAGDAPARKNRFSVNRTAGSMPVWKPGGTAAAFAPQNAVATNVDAAQKPGFRDLVDIINPLQHIPVVGHFYRKLTGDDISPAAQFAGATLFGGPVGGVAAMADIALRERTGKNGLDTVLSMGGETGQAKLPDIALTPRWVEAPRMAGTQPVWNGGHKLSPQTNFALLLNDLGDTPNIS